METVTLGMTDLKVSRIAFGAWELGGEWGSFDENAATATIRYAASAASPSSTPRRRTASAPPNGSSAGRCVTISTSAARRS